MELNRNFFNKIALVIVIAILGELLLSVYRKGA